MLSVDETHMPQDIGRRISAAVRIKCIDAIGLGCDENYVPNAFAWDYEARGIQRLGVYVAVHLVCGNPPELVRADIRRGKDMFAGILASPTHVIVVGKDTRLCQRNAPAERCDYQCEQLPQNADDSSGVPRFIRRGRDRRRKCASANAPAQMSMKFLRQRTG